MTSGKKVVAVFFDMVNEYDFGSWCVSDDTLGLDVIGASVMIDGAGFGPGRIGKDRAIEFAELRGKKLGRKVVVYED